MSWRICDWDDHFENNRTRNMKRMEWVPIPNKMDGDGYTELLDHQNGASHFAAWVALVEIASRCEIRGTLLRKPSLPHDFASLSRLSRIPESVFREAIPRLLDIGWIEELNVREFIELHDGAENSQAPAPEVGCIPQAPDASRTRAGASVPFRSVPFQTYISDKTFLPFTEAALQFWPDLIEEDLQTAWAFSWKRLDFEQKLIAVQILTERISIGEDSHYVKRPPKYLENGDWKRKPRPPSGNGNNRKETAAEGVVNLMKKRISEGRSPL